MPGELTPTLVHGDYRLGNLLFRTVVPTAVLDWEIWSIADPRLDLGWFIARAVTGHPSHPDDALGFPTAADLLATYTRGAPDPPALTWFIALAAVKHAAASALIDKRSAGSRGRDRGRIGRLLRWAESQLVTHEEEIHHV
jgi:aminoglycoside phosphotransferase (APT) family kinase protein